MEALQHSVLPIAGMDCADCALKLERSVGQLLGVASCTVSFAAAQITLAYDPGVLRLEQVVQRVRALGYDVPQAAAREQQRRSPWAALRERPRAVLTALAALSAVAAALVGWRQGPMPLTVSLYAASLLAAGYYPARKAAASLRYNRSLDMNALMTIAAVGAAAIGEWAEAAVVLVLFNVGELLEGYTVGRARRAVQSLMDLAPAEATALRPCLDCEGHLGQRLPDGRPYQQGPCPWCEPHEVRLPVAELAVGDVVLVRPGERIPVDGVVRSGFSAVNQAPITGESLPVDKAPGDAVFAGTLNGHGALTVEVTRPAADNTLSRMVALVMEAQARKAPTQRWVDAFARVYTPAVVAVAVALALVPPLLFDQPFLDTPDARGWLYRSLALLVIACPCALVISTPVTVVAALAAAARHGVLIKGGAYLEAMSRVRVMVFDKTGTLTLGQPALTSFQCTNHQADTPSCEECDDLLALAAAVERRSEHPIAAAVVQAAAHRRLERRYAGATGVESLAGRGVRGVVGDRIVSVVSHRHLHELQVDEGQELCQRLRMTEANGQTTMVVHDGVGVLGFLAVADQVRPESAEAIAALRKAGVQCIVVLTGDNEAAAQAIGRQVGADEVLAELLPQDKVDAVRSLAGRYGAVAMVGDGVNDTPALAAATVGIALGTVGSAQALETADVALMGGDLAVLPFLVRLSHSTRRILSQNIFLSLAIKALFLVLALLGGATLWMAVFADMGASLLVTLNGMRLLAAQPDRLRT